ncbi:MAG: aminotransferase class I/II-fold pyridoxal phosphate-dependent enzyme [Raoultibacter sp.]
MPALRGFNLHLDQRPVATVVPEQPVALPYEMRTEVNWLDFSCVTNPLGTPRSFINAIHTAFVDGEVAYKPDNDAYALRQALSKYFGLCPEAFLCCASTTEMIRSVAQAFQPCKVGVALPTLPEYGLALTNAGHTVAGISNPQSFVTRDPYAARRDGVVYDAALLANPSYPASRLLPQTTLMHYLEACHWVIVDESYIELTLGGESFYSLTERYRNLIVVRSISSSFNMAGIPLSYCVAHPQTIAHIEQFFDRSNISMFAEVLAGQLCDQEEFLDQTHEFLDTEIPWAQCMLSLIPGIQVFPAEANYVLCTYESSSSMELGAVNAADLIARLQLAGFLVRDLEGVEGFEDSRYFCVGIRNRHDNERLLAGLKKIISCS